MRKAIFGLAASALALSLGATPAAADPAQVKQAVAADYDSHLEDLFKHFHANPELSFLETETAKRMAAASAKACCSEEGRGHSASGNCGSP